MWVRRPAAQSSRTWCGKFSYAVHKISHAKSPKFAKLLVARRVYFINTWCYPSSANADEGPGEYIGSDGLITTVYKYVASISRRDVYPSAGGGDLPDAECDYVICSYFPDDGRVCLKNIDFRKPHTIDVHVFGKSRTVTLRPAEMRMFRA